MLSWLLANSLAVLPFILALLLAQRCIQARPGVWNILWVMVLLRMVLPPVVEWPWQISLESFKSKPEVVQLSAEELEELQMKQLLALAYAKVAGIAEEAEAEVEDEAIPEPPPEKPFDWKFSLVAVWSLGAVFVLCRTSLGIRRFRRLARHGFPAQSDLAEDVRALARRLRCRTPGVRVLAGLVSPLVWVFGRPTLYWPFGLENRLSDSGRQAVLTHELAHLKRNDHWIRRLEIAAGLLHWWNPLYWIVRSQVRKTSELACDWWVVKMQPSAKRSYAEALLEVSRGLSPASPVPALGIRGGGKRELERRLEMIMRNNGNSRRGRITVLAVGTLGLIALPGWSLGQAEKPVVAQEKREEQKPDAAEKKISDDAKRVMEFQRIMEFYNTPLTAQEKSDPAEPEQLPTPRAEGAPSKKPEIPKFELRNAQSLDEGIKELELARAKKTQSLGENHPEVLAIDKRIKTLREIKKNYGNSDLTEVYFKNLELTLLEKSQTLGATHPDVKKIEDLVKYGRELLKKQAPNAELEKKTAEEQIADPLKESILPFENELRKKTQELGSDHPEVQALEKRVSIWRAMLERRKREGFVVEPPKPPVKLTPLEEQLYELEVALGETTHSKGPDHPDVKAIEAKINALRELFKKREAEAKQSKKPEKQTADQQKTQALEERLHAFDLEWGVIIQSKGQDHPDVKAIEAKMSVLREQMKKQPPNAEPSKTPEKPTSEQQKAQSLEDSLRTLELALKEKRQSLGDSHPDVKAIEKRLTTLQEIMKKRDQLAPKPMELPQREQREIEAPREIARQFEEAARKAADAEAIAKAKAADAEAIAKAKAAQQAEQAAKTLLIEALQKAMEAEKNAKIQGQKEADLKQHLPFKVLLAQQAEQNLQQAADDKPKADLKLLQLQLADLEKLTAELQKKKEAHQNPQALLEKVSKNLFEILKQTTELAEKKAKAQPPAPTPSPKSDPKAAPPKAPEPGFGTLQLKIEILDDGEEGKVHAGQIGNLRGFLMTEPGGSATIQVAPSGDKKPGAPEQHYSIIRRVNDPVKPVEVSKPTPIVVSAAPTNATSTNVETLERATYTLPGKAETLAKFIKENVKAKTLELSVDKDKLVITTDPHTQKVIGEFIALLLPKAPHAALERIQSSAIVTDPMGIKSEALNLDLNRIGLGGTVVLDGTYPLTGQDKSLPLGLKLSLPVPAEAKTEEKKAPDGKPISWPVLIDPLSGIPPEALILDGGTLLLSGLKLETTQPVVKPEEKKAPATTLPLGKTDEDWKIELKWNPSVEEKKAAKPETKPAVSDTRTIRIDAAKIDAGLLKKLLEAGFSVKLDQKANQFIIEMPK